MWINFSAVLDIPARRKLWDFHYEPPTWDPLQIKMEAAG
jgi:hypothetical protein